MVEHHDDHNQPAQQVHVVEALAGGRGGSGGAIWTGALDAVRPRGGVGAQYGGHVCSGRGYWSPEGLVGAPYASAQEPL